VHAARTLSLSKVTGGMRHVYYRLEGVMHYLITTAEDWQRLAREHGLDPDVRPDHLVWHVGEITFVDYPRAWAYVEAHPMLRPYAAIILHDWPDPARHLAWVCTSPADNVVRWAQSLECRMG
jgi:hypothetical protein